MSEDCKYLLNFLDERFYSNFEGIKNVSEKLRNSPIYSNLLDLAQIEEFTNSLNKITGLISRQKDSKHVEKSYFLYIVAFETFKDALMEIEGNLEKNSLKNCETSEQTLIFLLNQLLYVFPKKGTLHNFAKNYVKHKEYLEK